MGYYRSIKDTTIQVEAVKHDGSKSSLSNIRTLISVSGENNNAYINGGIIFINTRKGRYFVPKGHYVVKDSTEDVFISSPTDFADIYESGQSTSATGASTISEVDSAVDDVDISLTAHIADTDNPHEVSATDVSLGNVTNESKATMFDDPTFTGEVSLASSTAWSFEQSGTDFLFKYNGTTKAKIDSSGNLHVAGTVNWDVSF